MLAGRGVDDAPRVSFCIASIKDQAMSPTAIFWPMIAHVALVGIVYGVLGMRRGRALRSGEAKMSAFRTRGGAEPASSATASANLMNQFEVPILLHIVCLALFVTSGVSYVSVVLAWLFVALRCLHAWLHLGANDVRHRSGAFAAGVLVLGVLWIYFALHLLDVV